MSRLSLYHQSRMRRSTYPFHLSKGVDVFESALAPFWPDCCLGMMTLKMSRNRGSLQGTGKLEFKHGTVALSNLSLPTTVLHVGQFILRARESQMPLNTSDSQIQRGRRRQCKAEPTVGSNSNGGRRCRAAANPGQDSEAMRRLKSVRFCQTLHDKQARETKHMSF